MNENYEMNINETTVNEETEAAEANPLLAAALLGGAFVGGTLFGKFGLPRVERGIKKLRGGDKVKVEIVEEKIVK